MANVKTLMDLYQQTIEYYSALGDDKFAYYLKNMHQMLGREDISIILSSAEEEAAAEKKRDEEGSSE